ncbi:MAG: transaldolase family protein [Planctomycetota bacterium]
MSPIDLDHVAPSSPLADALRARCLDGFDGPAAPTTRSDPRWQPLLDCGTELWLDTGDIDVVDRLWCREVSALTTNNTLLNKEIQKGLYDAAVPELAALIRGAAPDLDDRGVVLEVAFALNAIHGLTLVGRFGGKVSVELHTDLARDIDASVAYGRRYHAICPTHFIVKVPLTPEGLVAARRLSDEGIPVNFTLGFSARQNLVIAGLARPSWCNVFMGRINAFLADRGLGDGRNAGEKATAASQAAVLGLRAEGLCPTRQIGASMRSADQVSSLAGLDVYTAPPAVAEEWLADGSLREDLANRLSDGFEVGFADGVDPEVEHLGAFWDVDPALVEAVHELAAAELPSLGPRGIVERIGQVAPDLFPSLTGAELKKVVDGGKIPSFEAWRDDVRTGRLAWDSLLTLAGLASFAQDQEALDARVRGLLS